MSLIRCGAGGMVVLMSDVRVDLATGSEIDISGGRGGDAAADVLPGGGGGGGILHVVAPAFTNHGNVMALGGDPGAGDKSSVTLPGIIGAGAGGGALGGAGGSGGAYIESEWDHGAASRGMATVPVHTAFRPSEVLF